MKEEPLNAECDIERVTLHCAHPEKVVFSLGDTIKDVLFADSVIYINVRNNAPLDEVTLELRLTDGAIVTGSPMDVKEWGDSKTGHFTVKSQDGNWTRNYRLTFMPVTVEVTDTIAYDFEHYELEPDGRYYVWYNVLDDGSRSNDWASGNAGYSLSMSSATPLMYPSSPLVDGYDGAAVKLVTCDTGPFGAMVKKPIAAGNFFLGSFDLIKALTETLKATRFGIPFAQKPVKFIGYYRYKSGPEYKDKDGNVVAGKRDEASIYSVIYRNRDADGNAVVLDGADVLTNPNIVAIAKMATVPETAEWTYFEVKYDYKTDIDYALLEQLGYSFTMVFSSSADGADFTGAIGSTLCVDKVRVICTREE